MTLILERHLKNIIWHLESISEILPVIVRRDPGHFFPRVNIFILIQVLCFVIEALLSSLSPVQSELRWRQLPPRQGVTHSGQRGEYPMVFLHFFFFTCLNFVLFYFIIYVGIDKTYRCEDSMVQKNIFYIFSFHSLFRNKLYQFCPMNTLPKHPLDKAAFIQTVVREDTAWKEPW